MQGVQTLAACCQSLGSYHCATLPPPIQGLSLLDEVVARADPLFLFQEPEPVSRMITSLVLLQHLMTFSGCGNPQESSMFLKGLAP